MPSWTLRSLRPPAALLLALPFAACDGCDPAVDDDDSATTEPTPAPVEPRGEWLDMTLDADGRVYVAYRHLDDTALYIARGTGDPIQWTHWPADGKGQDQGGLLVGNFDAGQHATIAVADDGTVHAAYYQADEQDLVYVTGSDGTFERDVVDSSGDVGKFASIALVGGEPLIAYYDAARGQLKVASRAGGDWDDEVVDDGAWNEGAGGDDDDSAAPAPSGPADVGSYADLTVGSNGVVHIAYYDATNGDLRVASGSFGNWAHEAWATEGDVGQWPSIMAQGGDLHVSFLDVERQSLLYGFWTGSALNIEVVDNGDFVGADSSLAVAGADPVIAYQDARNNDARIARRAGGSWTVTTHMTDGAVGFHNNIAVGSDGRLNWSCYDHTNHAIVFQRLD